MEECSSSKKTIVMDDSPILNPKFYLEENMSKPMIFRTLSLVIALAFVLAACAPAATPTPEAAVETKAPAEPTQPPPPTPTAEPTATPAPQIGSAERPIKVLFVPSVDAEKIVASGQLLAEALNKATGLTFEVVVPTSYAATIEEMCASPDDTIGFIPGLGYVLAEQLCGVRVAGKAVRFGFDWYAAMIVVARDSAYQTIAELNGKKWAYPDAASTSGYLYPLYMFKEAGITPGESVAAGSHDAAIKAVYNGEADFGTAFFSPPRVDGKAIDWQPGQNPDVPADLLDSCGPTQDEKALVCGNFEIRDARRNLRKELPDVAQKVRILATTPKIPNDTVSFGPDFPEDLMQKIMEALFAFAQNDPEGFAKALEAYSWTGINPATDAEYDPIRFAIQASGFKIEDLGK
jgi:phosphonate transport system substrate-binding protein